jgi:flagellar basal-body rod protein FlgB
MANDISDIAVLAALRRQLSVAATRQSVSAGNLANLDTPGFKTRELKFSDELEKQLGGELTLAATNLRHLSVAPVGNSDTQDADGLPERRDGNNVQLDRELLSMTTAAGDFAKAQTALAAKFRLVRYAINEGK